MQVGLLVEDHCDAQAWLAEALKAAFPNIKLALADSVTKGRASLEHLCNAGISPDMALVDLGLPDGSGIEIINALRKQAPECICVVASRYTDDAHLFSALQAGARGYLLKQQPQTALVQLLGGIARGEPPLSPAIARRLLAEFGPPPAPDTVEARSTTEPAQLSPREREVLSLLTKGHTLTKVGALLGITRHTVAAHVKRIYEKLEISSRAEASLEAVRLGIVG